MKNSQKTKWCGCKLNEECKGHDMKVSINGKIQPHINAYDYLKYVVAVRTGKIKPGSEITV